MGVRDFLSFFQVHPWRSHPTNLHAIWLKRRGFTQGCAFCSKSCYFSYSVIFRRPKRSKFCKFLDFFYIGVRVTWYHACALTLQHCIYEHMMFGAEYLVTSRDPERSRSWPHYVWSQLSRKRLETQTWLQWSTYRKLGMASRIVWCSMSSRMLVFFRTDYILLHVHKR